MTVIDRIMNEPVLVFGALAALFGALADGTSLVDAMPVVFAALARRKVSPV